MFFGINKNGKASAENYGIIENFEMISLKISGMRGTNKFELICRGNDVEISYYSMRYTTGKGEYVLEDSVSCDSGAVISKLNESGITSWNGFKGKHPKNVLDGRMFDFTASVNGGKMIRAEGSENFPKHFHDFTGWLYEILREK